MRPAAGQAATTSSSSATAERAQDDAGAADTARVRRPENAFILFSNDFRKKVRAQNKYMTNGELSKILGHAWRTLPAAEKRGYELAAKKLRAQFRKENPGYQFFTKREGGPARRTTSPLSDSAKEAYARVWESARSAVPVSVSAPARAPAATAPAAAPAPAAPPQPAPKPGAVLVGPPPMLSAEQLLHPPPQPAPVPASSLPRPSSPRHDHAPAPIGSPAAGAAASAAPACPPSPPMRMFSQPSFGSFGTAAPRRRAAPPRPLSVPISALDGSCCPPGSVCGPGQRVCGSRAPPPGEACGPPQPVGGQAAITPLASGPAVQLSMLEPAAPAAVPCCSELGSVLPPLGGRAPAAGGPSWDSWTRHLPPLAALFPELERRPTLAPFRGA